jgi:hypothetical protein
MGLKMAAKRHNSVPVEDCRDFLVALVNDRKGLRNLYKAWFPSDILADERDLLLKYYVGTSPRWKSKTIPQPEPPADVNSIYIAGLRHKLRVIWHTVKFGANPQALVTHLWTETRTLQHERQLKRPTAQKSPDEEEWSFRTQDAVNHLSDDLGKLMKCAIPDCKERPLFIRRPNEPKKKYCGEVCSALAERKRVHERSIKLARKDSRLPPKARARISAAQKKRWDDYRRNNPKS